jgi:hypothetical protein
MKPTNYPHIHGIEVSTPPPKINCMIAGCNHSFKNRSGFQSHIRARHSAMSLHPAQPLPLHSHKEDHGILMDLDHGILMDLDHGILMDLDHSMLMDLDQPPSPSPSQSGSTRVCDDDNHREPSSVSSGDQRQVITHIYHPVMNGKNSYNVVSQF